MRPSTSQAWYAVLLTGVLLLLTAAVSRELPVEARFKAAPFMALPGYVAAVTDPVTGFRFERMTDTGRAPAGDGACGAAYCTHRYSSSQAWNADESLLLIANDCAGWCFLDGQTYAPRFVRHRSGACEWHPVRRDVMICVSGLAVSLWSPESGRDDVVYVGRGYRELQFGPSKGNPSRDGNRIVLRGSRADGTADAFVVDLAARQALPVIHLDQLPGTNSACTISPSGLYVLCWQTMSEDVDTTFIFSADGKPVQTWRENHRPGHGDMTFDADGEEIYVGISKSQPDIYQVIKRRLRDGTVTSLAPYGEAEHISTRALRKPQWAFASYGGRPGEVAQQPKWAPFAQEVVALSVDGSGTYRRIAQTRNTPHDYWSETHASPSPSGAQIIWSSNWGHPGGPVFDFVTRMSLPTGGDGRIGSRTGRTL